MLPIKKILCPTDFSEPSYEALKRADELAMHFSAELILVHVVPPIPIIPSTDVPEEVHTPSYPLDLESKARDTLQRVVESYVSHETKANAMVLHGNVADEIVKAAEHEDVDILVTATHGLTGWQRLLFGSVAEKVIRLAPCPVLSIQIAPEEE